jgi:phospholipid:diacylglycerol acyltransferase
MASTLRKRGHGNAKGESARPGTPETAEEVRLAPVSKIMTGKHAHEHKWRKRRNGLIFFLGGLFGIVAAGFFAKENNLIDFPELSDLTMDSLFDVLPAGLIKDARDLSVRA